MNPTSASNQNMLNVLSAIDLPGYASSTSTHGASSRENARSPCLAGEIFAKAALRAAGKSYDLRAAQPERSEIFSAEPIFHPLACCLHGRWC